MKTAKFKIEEIYRRTYRETWVYQFTLQSANGKILAVSEKPYTRKHDCKRAIAALQRALGSNLVVVDQTESK